MAPELEMASDVRGIGLTCHGTWCYYTTRPAKPIACVDAGTSVASLTQAFKTKTRGSSAWHFLHTVTRSCPACTPGSCDVIKVLVRGVDVHAIYYDQMHLALVERM